MKKMIMILLLAIGLTSCGLLPSQQQVLTVCTYNDEEMNVKYDFVSKNDQLISEVSENSFVWADYLSEDLMVERLEKIKETYNAIDGLTYSYTMDETRVNELIKIDYEVADVQELIDVEILLSSSGEEVTYASLAATIDSLERAGATCE